MQRKNNILMQRNAMAMIMAIVVLVVLATIMAMSLAMTSKTAKKTADLYLYEQAILLSESASEYAMLRIADANPCSLENIPEFTYNDIFKINISMKYIAFTGSPCDGNTVQYATTTYSDTDGTVIIDIAVETLPDAYQSEPIRFFRRIIAKM